LPKQLIDMKKNKSKAQVAQQRKEKNINYLLNVDSVKDCHKAYHNKYEWTIVQIMRLIGNRKIDSLLEIGCHYGAILMLLKERLHLKDYAGVDLLDQKELKKNYGYEFPFIRMDLNVDDPGRLPKKDLVLMTDVLEHLDNPVSVLRRLQIKKYLLIKIPIEKGVIKNVLMALGLAAGIGPTHPSGHLHGFYLSEGLDLVKRGNLRIIEWFYTFNPLWLNYPNINKGFTLPKKMFYCFDYACRALLPRRMYLALFGGTLLMLCERAK